MTKSQAMLMIRRINQRFPFLGKVVKVVFVIFSVVFIVYLLFPAPEFPNPPSNSVQSKEPADTETPLRRAYFTDSGREEVMQNYLFQFSREFIPTLRLNYPPEEAQTLIRDQTRSTFLEELVHPFRESLYVNGFEPKDAKDEIIIDGVHWRQKIIVRYVPSLSIVRILIAIPTLVLIWVVLRQWGKEI